MESSIRPLAIGLDKVRFGINNIGGKSMKNTLKVCRDLVQAKQARTLRSTGQTHKYRYSITLVEGQTLYVAFRPHNKDGGHPRFVAEFNPNKLGAEGLEEARVVFLQFFEQRFERVMSSAFLTLLDYYADYPVKVQELLIEMTRKEVCATWGLQFNAHFIPQTLYLGSGGSDGQVRAYDTEAEGIAATAKAGRDGKIEEVLNAHGKAMGCRMRIEGRRLPRSLPLDRVHELDNPFARVSISKISEDAPEFQTPVGRILLTAASAVGWQIALKRLGDPDMVRRFRRAFAKYKCDWWKPDEAAVDVGVALYRMGVFPALAFDPKVKSRSRSAKQATTVTFDCEQYKAYKRELKMQKTDSHRKTKDANDKFLAELADDLSDE